MWCSNKNVRRLAYRVHVRDRQAKLVQPRCGREAVVYSSSSGCYSRNHLEMTSTGLYNVVLAFSRYFVT